MPRHLIGDLHERSNETSTVPTQLSSETTAWGTGHANTAGKEDPVELNSSM